MYTDKPNYWLFQAGVSYLEIILVVAILLVVMTAGAPFYANFFQKNAYQSSTQNVITTLRKAQIYAMDNKDNGTWGACQPSGKVRLYRGNCATPDFYQDYEIPQSVTITGLSDTTFTKGRGEPSNSLTILIASDIESNTVTLNSAGMLSIQ